MQIDRHRILLALITFGVTSWAIAQPPVREADIPLEAAVDEFNHRESKTFADAKQPVVTMEEIKAAIRRMPLTARHQSEHPLFPTLLKIAETDILPRNAYLTILRGTYTDTHYVDVFDIQMTVIKDEDVHLTLPIRQVSLSSRRLRPGEPFRSDEDEGVFSASPNVK